MDELAAAVQHHLHETLGISPEMTAFAAKNALPYYLHEAFRFFEMELLGRPVVLAMAPAKAKKSLSEVRTWLEKVSAIAGKPTLFVTDALASYERRYLIEQKVPFIVPGNQLYLPDLGIDLREHFRQRGQDLKPALSPSTQALLIKTLLHQHEQNNWRPADMARGLGYTNMTIWRSIKELQAAELVAIVDKDSHTPNAVGVTGFLRLTYSPQQTWEKVLPALRNPVKRTIWVDSDSIELGALGGRLAGLSALARRSILSEPRRAVVAMIPAQWKALQASGIRKLPEAMPDSNACELQLWSYNPALLPDADTVDPLSLTLSLQDNADTRVQQALDELKRQLPW